MDVRYVDPAVRNTPPTLLHVADPLRRRITQAGHEFTGPPEPSRQSENPPQQGLPNHGAHDRHRRLQLCWDGLLGALAEADRIGQVMKQLRIWQIV